MNDCCVKIKKRYPGMMDQNRSCSYPRKDRAAYLFIIRIAVLKMDEEKDRKGEKYVL